MSKDSTFLCLLDVNMSEIHLNDIQYGLPFLKQSCHSAPAELLINSSLNKEIRFIKCILVSITFCNELKLADHASTAFHFPLIHALQHNLQNPLMPTNSFRYAEGRSRLKWL